MALDEKYHKENLGIRKTQQRGTPCIHHNLQQKQPRTIHGNNEKSRRT